MGHNIAHEVDLAPLLGSAQKALFQCALNPHMGVTDQQCDLLEASGLEFVEKGFLGYMGFSSEGFDGQNLSSPLLGDAIETTRPSDALTFSYKASTQTKG